MPYHNLAFLYDKLMEDIDYLAWADYLEGLINEFSSPGKDLMDLGCGTGSISLEMVRKGYTVIGIDSSVEMLAQAEQKFRSQGLQAAFFHQDMRKLVFNKSMDIVLATFDAFNYLLKEQEISNVLQRIMRILNPGGLLIFDLNTAYKLKEILGDEIFTYNTREICYLWENSFDYKRNISQMYLSFFILDQATGLYRRFNEEHRQRAYEVKDIESILKISGFRILAIYDELSKKQPTKNSKRVFFIAKKD